MANDSLEVSLVICAYTQDRWSDLKQAIQSIRQQTVLPDEIILVIDHNPALYSLALETFDGVKVIENQEPRGLSGARNSGIASANGKVIAFIDEDAVAAPDWIERLLSGYGDPRVIGVGGNIQPLWADARPAWFPEEFNWVVGCSYKGLPTTPAPVRNLLGCNMSFRQEIFTGAGGFRNGIGRIGTVPVGCEETELCIRILQQYPSSSLLYLPDAKVYHRVPGWRSGWKYFLHRCFAEGLSKAQVTRLVGAGDGLESERRYVLKTLTRAMFDGLAETFLHGRLVGIERAAAVAAGLSLTTFGYFNGLAMRSHQAGQPVATHPQMVRSDQN